MLLSLILKTESLVYVNQFLEKRKHNGKQNNKKKQMNETTHIHFFEEVNKIYIEIKIDVKKRVSLIGDDFQVISF